MSEASRRSSEWDEKGGGGAGGSRFVFRFRAWGSRRAPGNRSRGQRSTLRRLARAAGRRRFVSTAHCENVTYYCSVAEGFAQRARTPRSPAPATRAPSSTRRMPPEHAAHASRTGGSSRSGVPRLERGGPVRFGRRWVQHEANQLDQAVVARARPRRARTRISPPPPGLSSNRTPLSRGPRQ